MTHQDDKDRPGHQRDELRTQRQHLCPIRANVLEWSRSDVDAEREDGEERREQHGEHLVEQQEDGHEQHLPHDDHHLPEEEVVLELVGEEGKYT